MTTDARRAVATVLAALLLGIVLNASSLRESAEAQPFGWRRTVAVAAATPLDRLTRSVALDLPARLARAVLVDAWRGPALVAARRVVVSGLAVPAPVAVVDAGAPVPAPAPLAAPVHAAASPPPPGGRAEPAPRIRGPLSMWTAGDSVSGQLGLALQRRGAEQGFAAQAEYRISTGLCRPDVHDWPARIDAETGRLDPRAVVLLFGANDNQRMKVGDRYVSFGTEEWKAEYGRRVSGVMRRLTDARREVYWVGQPVMRDAAFGDQMKLLNSIYAAQAAAVAGVSYVDAWSVFVDGTGGYAEYLPDEHGRAVRVREGDGVHLTAAGGDRLAAAVLKAVAGRREPPPTPGPEATPAPTPSPGLLPLPGV